MTTYAVRVSTPVDAREAMGSMYRSHVQPHTKTGAAGVLTWQTESSWLREKMRGAFHGHILDAFADQVWFRDEKTGLAFRYAKPVWKEYLKQQFLTPKYDERIVKGTGELKLRARRLSTEELSDDEYGEFMLKVQAFGVVDLGIEFDEEGY